MALKCRGCGCTTDRACPGGCSWVSTNPPICSACVDDDLPSGIGLASVLDDDADRCPSSPVGAPHRPIFTSADAGHCVACKQPFQASAA